MSKKYMTEANRIAVIGGGVTGLATCYYGAKHYPDAEITLFEGSNRFGGAIESVFVEMDDGRAIVCEMGVRTLRANAPRAIVMIDLIRELGLEHELAFLLKSDNIASRRYIYYPDHLVAIPVANVSKSIVHIPAPDAVTLKHICTLVRMVFTEPLSKGLMTGIGQGLFTKRPLNVVNDDSIGNLLVRRFGKQIAENIGSAIIHGLYAGNMHKLSARALTPGLWALDTRFPLVNFHSRVTKQPTNVSPMDDITQKWIKDETDMLKRIRNGPAGDLEKRIFRDISVFSFKRGVGRLTERLQEEIYAMRNIKIRSNSPVKSISGTNNDMLVHTDFHSEPFSHIISTTSLPTTLDLLGIKDLPTITHVPVMTVAFCYATPNLNHPHRGFGYLIPESVPPQQNPEKALGVIFDSDAITNQDHFQGTKISVMLGGHYWSSHASLPTTDEGVAMAKSVLQRHLGITEEPLKVFARLKKEAIPQYPVGHHSRLKRVHEILKDYGGRMRVAGNSYMGIGVHDCLFSARRIVEKLDDRDRTGLEMYQ